MSGSERAEDPSPALRQAIALAKQTGLDDAATEFESACFAPFATHEEWLGALPDLIQRFRAACDTAVPREIEVLLQRAIRSARQADR